MKATLDHLLKPSIDHGTVSVDGLDFEIRPLSRSEQIKVQETRERDGLGAADALLVHLGLVAPALGLDDSIAWQGTPGQGAVVAAVSEGIGRISGMMPDSGKAAYKSSGE